MTTRQLRRRVREHVLGISAATTQTDLALLTTIPRHFKEQHNCDTNLLKPPSEFSFIHRRLESRHPLTIKPSGRDLLVPIMCWAIVSSRVCHIVDCRIL